MSAPSPSCPDDAAARRLARSMAVVSAFCLTGDTMLYIALPLFWQECGLTALWQVGVLLAVNRLVRLPLNPLVRLLYTRIDQRTGMALAVVLAASTTLLYGVAQSFALWLLLRCLWGLAWTLLRLGSLFALMAASRKDNRGYLMGSYNGLVRLGSLLGMNDVAAAGMVATLANNIPMFQMLHDMDRRGKIINVAFAVSAAFVFGDHLGFTAGFDSTMIFPMIVGKLVGGVTAVAVAMFLTRKETGHG